MGSESNGTWLSLDNWGQSLSIIGVRVLFLLDTGADNWGQSPFFAGYRRWDKEKKDSDPNYLAGYRRQGKEKRTLTPLVVPDPIGIVGTVALVPDPIGIGT